MFRTQIAKKNIMGRLATQPEGISLFYRLNELGSIIGSCNCEGSKIDRITKSNASSIAFVEFNLSSNRPTEVSICIKTGFSPGWASQIKRYNLSWSTPAVYCTKCKKGFLVKLV